MHGAMFNFANRFRREQPPAYSALLEEAEHTADDKAPFIDSEDALATQTPKCFPFEGSILWFSSTVFFMSLCVVLFFTSTNESRLGSFERGYVTELAAARPQIVTHKYRFTGGPTFAADGTETLRLPADEPRYVGEPTQEMDDAWFALTSYRYFLLTEDEAREAWGSEYTQFWNEQAGGYQAALDHMHLLHCLDHIRQSFYPERYPHQGIHGELHRDHCIDSLRQVLLCNADLTPIPSRWYPGLGQNYIDSDRVHVCRDPEQIRRWQKERMNGSVAVMPWHRGFP